jgi:hypothetical protein
MIKELYMSDEVGAAIQVAAAAEALSVPAYLRRVVVRDLKANGHLAPGACLTPGAAKRKAENAR